VNEAVMGRIRVRPVRRSVLLDPDLTNLARMAVIIPACETVILFGGWGIWFHW